MKRSHPLRRQQGAVLFVGLVMLILITLLAVSAIRLANTNLLVAGNEQLQKEAEDAANYHLDLALNADNFTLRNVNRSAPLPAFSDAAVTPETSYTVKIPPPKCKRYRFVKVSELTETVKETVDGEEKEYIRVRNLKDDLPCFRSDSGSGLNLVLDPATLNENSLCATSLWEMTANVELAGGSTKAEVKQGVEMRIDHAEAETACKPDPL